MESGYEFPIGPTVPESMIPDDLKKIFKGDQYELAFVCSEYGSATDEVNAQLAEIDKIVKKYDNTAMVIGEAPLMKDLQDTRCRSGSCKCNLHRRHFHDHYDYL